ncbi:hypothetical protein SAMN05216223_101159 [Actinacidiphila yanglinensis]|uniref:Lipoprotein n=1 Tax=Actinacidiphila yanglinensis TaxID=310779 RepID=A0A1H5SJZ1_9ACTN|nr:hypothetical protein [Actinacidiphila yanglinensis]SEF50760.1 hypothetical protein SAMN05216223_101159 [Actinacidiphila yanglinensis]
MPNPPRRSAVPASLALAGTAIAASSLITGCSQSRLHGCAGTSLSVRNTHVARLAGDLPLSATLTARGRPVAGQRVNFRLYYRRTGEPPGAGVFAGTKPTGTDGVARLTLVGGPAGALLPGATPTGFGAQKPRRKDYCAASGKAKLLCGATAAACSPARKPTS